MAELVFNNRAVSRLKEAISATATSAKIFDGDYSKFLASHSAGDFFYAILRGPSNREVVKVNITGSSVASGLSIERGQDGTTARAWPRGALLTAQELTAAMLSDFVSKGFRTTAVTPVETVTPAFIGEKIFWSGVNRWYKAAGATSADWVLIAGAGLAWTYTEGVLSGDTYFTPAVAYNTVSDTVDMVYLEAVGKSYTLYHISRSSGGWGTPEDMSGSGPVDYPVALFVDSSGYLHCITDSSGSFYYYTNASGSWVSVLAGQSPHSSNGVYVAMDSNDKLHVAFTSVDDDDGTGGVYYFTNSGGSWTSEEQAFAASDSAYCSYCAIAVGSDGTVHIIYNEIEAVSGNEGAYYFSGTAGSWTAPVKISDVRSYMSMTIDSSNNLHIAKAGTISGETYPGLNYLTKSGESWSTTEIAPLSPVDLSSDWRINDVAIIVNIAGTVYALVTYQTSGLLPYDTSWQVANNEDGWSTEEIVFVDTPPGMITNGAISADVNGLDIIAVLTGDEYGGDSGICTAEYV